MDTSRDGYRTGETALLRARTWVRTLLRGVGIVIVVVGALNLLGIEVWVAYRAVYDSVVVVGHQDQAVYVADAVVAAVGAIVAFVG